MINLRWRAALGRRPKTPEFIWQDEVEAAQGRFSAVTGRVPDARNTVALLEQGQRSS